MINFFTLFSIVVAVQLFFRSRKGKIIGHYLPAPFWIYFLPMIFQTFGLFSSNDQLPFLHHISLYDFLGKYILPFALVLTLIGTPLSEVRKIGGKALQAMGIGTATVLISTIGSFILIGKYLPGNASHAAGALLATWTGGSANMLAVKEALNISNQAIAPLIIVDTLLSYAWMALLISGVSFQDYFHQDTFHTKLSHAKRSDLLEGRVFRTQKILIMTVVLFFISSLLVLLGDIFELYFPFFNGRAWTLILTSGVAVLLSATQLNIFEKWGASEFGVFFLYLVLAGIGARTNLAAAKESPIYILFGMIIIIFHGILMTLFGKFLKIPLFLLSTASQANIGGPISAPIVATVYKPGAAQIGVMMGIIGNLTGTYIGLLGAWICSKL